MANTSGHRLPVRLCTADHNALSLARSLKSMRMSTSILIYVEFEKTELRVSKDEEFLSKTSFPSQMLCSLERTLASEVKPA